MLFASFSDTMNQGLMVALFSFATLIVLAKQFTAKHPEQAKKVGGVALKTGIGVARTFLKK
jgi:hypothetical protein